jgi:CheY-like chemotaxis protein
VTDLLDVSRIVAGRLQLNRQAVSLQQIVQIAVDSVHHAATAKNLMVTTTITGNPAPIDGDPDRLQQVILNLLSNAIKFTPPGGTIDVTLHRDDSHARLLVRDTGQGISPDVLPDIFDRFRQAGRIHTPTSGLGLGLTIARHIVEAHGGSIDAQSDGEATGATFVVRLPGAEGVLESPELPATTATAPLERAPELEGKGVLVVEDQPDSQALVAFVLGHCGMRVLTADSSETALEILDRQSVDVIVSDIRLSGEGDGFELIRAVRARGEPFGRVPAIVVSAFANTDDQSRALSAGYQLHVAKPVEPPELIAAVAALLRSKAFRAEEADSGSIS